MTITIQKTSKKIKRGWINTGIILTVGFLWLGIYLVMVKNGMELGKGVAYPCVVIFGGWILGVITRFNQWWNHE